MFNTGYFYNVLYYLLDPKYFYRTGHPTNNLSQQNLPYFNITDLEAHNGLNDNMLLAIFNMSLVLSNDSLRSVSGYLSGGGVSQAHIELDILRLYINVTRMLNMVPQIRAHMANSMPMEGVVADIDRRLTAIASKWTEDINTLTQITTSFGQGGVPLGDIRNSVDEMLYSWDMILGHQFQRNINRL